MNGGTGGQKPLRVGSTTAPFRNIFGGFNFLYTPARKLPDIEPDFGVKGGINCKWEASFISPDLANPLFPINPSSPFVVKFEVYSDHIAILKGLSAGGAHAETSSQSSSIVAFAIYPENPISNT